MLAPKQSEAWEPTPAPIERLMTRPGVLLMLLGGLSGVAAGKTYGLIFGIAGGLIFVIGFMRCIGTKFFSPLIVSCFVALLGLLPQLIFIVIYANARGHFAEPRALPSFVAAYEDLVVDSYLFLKSIGLGPVQGAIVNIGMFGMSVWMSWTPIPKLYATAQKWLGRASLALLAASSFTLASVAPSSAWTPNLPERIEALRKEAVESRAKLEVARAMLNLAPDADVVSEVSDVHLALVNSDCEMTLPIQCSQMLWRSFRPEAVFTNVPNLKPRFKTGDPARREAALAVMEKVVDKLGDEAAAADLGQPSLPPHAVAPDPPATLAALRSETDQGFRTRDLIGKLRKEVVDALKPKFVHTGDEFADELLNKLVDHFLDAASDRAEAFAMNAATARGGGRILDADLKMAAANMTRTLYRSNVSAKTQAELDGKIAIEIETSAIAKTLPKPTIEPGSVVHPHGRR